MAYGGMEVFVEAVRLAGTLKTEDIAKVLDAGETENGRPYFVMELVKGISLTEFCGSNIATGRRAFRKLVGKGI